MEKLQVAFVLDLCPEEQELLRNIIAKVKLQGHQTALKHVTILFMGDVASIEEAKRAKEIFEKEMKVWVKENDAPKFKPLCAHTDFMNGKVLVLEPDEKSRDHFKKINQYIFNILKNNAFQPDIHTHPAHYKPHLTLIRNFFRNKPTEEKIQELSLYLQKINLELSPCYPRVAIWVRKENLHSL